MNYVSTAGAINGSIDTIIPVPTNGNGTNNNKQIEFVRMTLSSGDIRQANKLYNCPSCGKTLLEREGSFGSPFYRGNKVQHATGQQ